jgi:cell wall-associated NlpC family hydrolase
MRNTDVLKLLLLTLPAASWGQAGSPQLLGPAASPSVTHGIAYIRVSSGTPAADRRLKLAVLLDGRWLSNCESLPWDMVWDSRTVPDGTHQLALALVDAGSRQTVRSLHTLSLTIRNSRTSSEHGGNLPSPKPRSPETENRGPAVRSGIPVQEGSSIEPASSPVRTKPIETGSPRTSLPSGRPSGRTDAPQPAQFSTTARRTTPNQNGTRLWWAEADGAVCSLDTSTGALLRSSAFPTGASALAARDDDLFAVRTDGTVHRYSVTDHGLVRTEYGRIPARIVTGIRPMILLCRLGVAVSDGNETALLGRSGEPKTIDPPTDASLQCLGEVDGVLTAFGTANNDTSQLMAWRLEGRRWRPMWDKPLTVVEPPNGFAVCGTTAVARTRTRLYLAEMETGAAHDIAIPEKARSSEPLLASAADIWWGRSGAITQVTLKSEKVRIYLPWNGASSLRPAACDNAGLWLTSGTKTERLNPEAPSTDNGYAGYIRTTLTGSGSETPEGDLQKRIAEAIESWQGTPYKFGGVSRTGIDCSGFVMNVFRECGILLPHGSESLRTCPLGALVKDELQFGDVLVYPGHCAIYIGDGLTAETVSGKVGYSDIWRRRQVVVRRFGDYAGDRSVLPSRKGSSRLRTPR